MFSNFNIWRWKQKGKRKKWEEKGWYDFINLKKEKKKWWQERKEPFLSHSLNSHRRFSILFSLTIEGEITEQESCWKRNFKRWIISVILEIIMRAFVLLLFFFFFSKIQIWSVFLFLTKINCNLEAFMINFELFVQQDTKRFRLAHLLMKKSFNLK